MADANILWFQQIGMQDLETVGGKNASLGEMINHLANSGVRVPGGFSTTAHAFREFLAQQGLDQRIYTALENLNVDDIDQLFKTGAAIRQWILEAELPAALLKDLNSAYQELDSGANIAVAVRSSATAEDLPTASFAGQQETFLNVRGFDHVLQAVKQVFASLFNDRAISYRVHQGFEHRDVALSVGIQRMVRSDIGSSGVMFSIDTESGFDQVVFITAAYGLGEAVVQGAVNPDEFYVYKPNLTAKRPAILQRTLGSKEKKMIYSDVSAEETIRLVDVDASEQRVFCLNDDDVEALARYAQLIEQHYGRPMDIEWAKDGDDGELYILQARPETVRSAESSQVIERYRLKQAGKVIVEGRSIGQKIGQGTVKIIQDLSHMSQLKTGDVLVTDMTDPDWEPVMKRAAAIVTNRGGRTCHAAIIARELGIPAVVGTQDATQRLQHDQAVTVSCAEGDTGFVYQDLLPFEIDRIDIEKMPELPIKVMLNIGNPERAFAFQRLPNAGIGLARLEFIISNTIGIHPKALLNFAQLKPELQQKIQQKTASYADPVEYYVARLTEGVATLAAAFAPKPVIVRLSDFKSNEYANLLGGEEFEPKEENPMIGFRGASRYVAERFRDCFALECQAIHRVRDDMGLGNVWIMIPFVRTVDEAKEVIEVLAENGLQRGEQGLKIIMMCEVPSNALLADQFLQYFDGFSIGSNDLTQLTLGLDRDSALIAERFDERDPAVKYLLHLAIQACRKANKYIGICGQGPSDHEDFAKWLMDEGIESVSLNPDSVLETVMYLAKSPL